MVFVTVLECVVLLQRGNSIQLLICILRALILVYRGFSVREKTGMYLSLFHHTHFSSLSTKQHAARQSKALESSNLSTTSAPTSSSCFTSKCVSSSTSTSFATVLSIHHLWRASTSASSCNYYRMLRGKRGHGGCEAVKREATVSAFLLFNSLFTRLMIIIPLHSLTQISPPRDPGPPLLLCFHDHYNPSPSQYPVHPSTSPLHRSQYTLTHLPLRPTAQPAMEHPRIASCACLPHARLCYSLASIWWGVMQVEELGTDTADADTGAGAGASASVGEGTGGDGTGGRLGRV